MKSWQNKVPLFFWFDAYLTLFSVPAFGQLANLKINFSQKTLVEPISKLVPFFYTAKKLQFNAKTFWVPGLSTWRLQWRDVVNDQTKSNWIDLNFGSFQGISLEGIFPLESFFFYVDCLCWHFATFLTLVPGNENVS